MKAEEKQFAYMAEERKIDHVQEEEVQEGVVCDHHRVDWTEACLEIQYLEKIVDKDLIFNIKKQWKERKD